MQNGIISLASVDAIAILFAGMAGLEGNSGHCQAEPKFGMEKSQRGMLSHIFRHRPPITGVSRISLAACASKALDLKGIVIGEAITSQGRTSIRRFLSTLHRAVMSTVVRLKHDQKLLVRSSRGITLK
jgi:hypothetical protein